MHFFYAFTRLTKMLIIFVIYKTLYDHTLFNHGLLEYSMVQHSRRVLPRWKKSGASLAYFPPRTSLDLKFILAVQLLFHVSSASISNCRCNSFFRMFLFTWTPRWLKKPLGTGQYLWEYGTGKWAVTSGEMYCGPVNFTIQNSVWHRIRLVKNFSRPC